MLVTQQLLLWVNPDLKHKIVFEDAIYCLAVLACSFKYGNQNFDADQ